MTQVQVVEKVKIIPLRGFIIDFDTPSTSVLEPIFNIVIEKNGEKIRIGKEKIRLLRKYWYNHIQYLNRRLYQRAHEICVKTSIGWLIPFENIDKLKSLEEEMLKKWKEFDKELREFLNSIPIVLETGDKSKIKLPEHLVTWIKSRYGEEGLNKYIDELVEYMKLVKEYLLKKGVLYEDLIKEIPYLPSKFRIKMYTFGISLEEVVEIIPQHVRKYVESKISETVELVKKDVVEKVKQDFEKIRNDILSITEEIKKEIVSKKISEVMKKFKELENKTSILGVDLRNQVRELREQVRKMIVKKEFTPYEIVSRIDLLTNKLLET